VTTTPRTSTTTHRSGRRPLLANVPGLRIFVSPDALAREPRTGPATAGEVVPWERPGSKLRVSPRAAGRGWYAPAAVGAPTTTRQARILNTALIGPPTGTDGIVNGRDVLSHTIVAHDAATAYNAPQRVITSPNSLVVGDVGSTKSSTVKVLLVRALTLRLRRAFVFDKKEEGGEGEYAELARRFGSESLRFATDGSGTRINLLDSLVVRGTGMQGQMQLMATTFHSARGGQPLDEWEREALRAALRSLLATDLGRAATPADLVPHLLAVSGDPAYAGLSAAARDRLHEAGATLAWVLLSLLDEYGNVFDGETSRAVDLAHKLTVWDVSQLPNEGPAVPVVMALGHMWLHGRLHGERGWITNVIYEEGWHVIGSATAELVKSNQKLSRSLGIANWFVIHKGTDIPPESPGYTVIQEAQTVYIHRMVRPQDAEWAVRTFGLEPDTAETVTGLPQGQCILKRAHLPETQVQIVRSRWEAGLTDTDTAMSAAAAPGR